MPAPKKKPEDYELDTDPHPDPVNGIDLCDDIFRHVWQRYTVLPDGAADVLTLWAIGTHALHPARFTHAPRLIVTAPVSDSGKSTVLAMLAHLVLRPEGSSGLSEAALFRTIDQELPTIILDECDTLLPGRGARSGLVRVLNSGHYRPQAFERRVEYDRTLQQHVTVKYSTFSMCALGGIAEKWIPPALRSRSFLIPLQPKMPHEHVADFNPDDAAPELRVLRAKVMRWVADHLDELRATRPQMDGLINRAHDNARVLCSVADVIGGEWSARARDAIRRLTPAPDDDPRMLLARVRDIVADSDDPLPRHKPGPDDPGRVWTADVCHRLAARIDWPYEKLTQHELARQLKVFGVRPDQSQEGGRGSRKGQAFWLRDFVEQFARYGIPPIPPLESSRPVDHAGPSTSLPISRRDIPNRQVTDGVRRVRAKDQMYTNPELARRIVEHFASEFASGDTFLDPARGQGAFFDYLPEPCDWCEIDPGVLPAGVTPRDFHDWDRHVEWAITNPPWGSRQGAETAPGYREFAQHAFEVADNVVFVIPNWCLTRSRREDSEAAGFGTKEKVYLRWQDAGWPPGYDLVAIHWRRGYTGDVRETRLSLDDDSVTRPVQGGRPIEAPKTQRKRARKPPARDDAKVLSPSKYKYKSGDRVWLRFRQHDRQLAEIVALTPHGRFRVRKYDAEAETWRDVRLPTTAAQIIGFATEEPAAALASGESFGIPQTRPDPTSDDAVEPWGRRVIIDPHGRVVCDLLIYEQNDDAPSSALYDWTEKNYEDLFGEPMPDDMSGSDAWDKVRDAGYDSEFIDLRRETVSKPATADATLTGFMALHPDLTEGQAREAMQILAVMPPRKPRKPANGMDREAGV